MTEKIEIHMLQQHQFQVTEGLALDPVWSMEAECCSPIDYRACERIAAAAPTAYLAGFWFSRSLTGREVQALGYHAEG